MTIPSIRSVSIAKWAICIFFIIVIVIWGIISSLPDGLLHVKFIDVGQGDAILVTTPEGSNILIDGGPSPQSLCLALGKELPFWERKLDLVIATQPHSDHISGLVEIIKRYDINKVMDNGISYDSEIYREWTRTIHDLDIGHLIARPNNKIELDNGIMLEILNPTLEALFENSSSDVDNNGIVLKLSWKEISFLLTADIRTEAEYKLIRDRHNLSSSVLKIAHHGSDTSTSTNFINAVNPSAAVVSVGEDNTYGHPSESVINRINSVNPSHQLFRTDMDGSVEFITDGERLWVSTWKS